MNLGYVRGFMHIKVILLLLCTTICNANEFGQNQTIAQEIATLLANDVDIKARQDMTNASLKAKLYVIDAATAFAEQGVENSWWRSFFYEDSVGPALAEQLNGLIPLCPQKAPRLHLLVEEVAHACNVPTPPIFLAGNKDIFNAMACSFTQNISMVILGKKLVEEMTDNELKAVIAHELGHVKFNHIPKALITNIVLLGGGVALAAYGVYKLHNVDPQTLLETMAIFSAAGAAAGLIAVYTTYRHECQADDEAIRAVGAQPFVDSMEAIKKYIMSELAIFDKEQAYCVSQLKRLEELAPEKAAKIKEDLEEMKTNMYEKIQEHLDTDWDHPALNKRIEYGKQHIIVSLAK